MSLIPYIYKSIESKYQVTSVIECTVKFAFDSCNIVSLTEPLINFRQSSLFVSLTCQVSIQRIQEQ